LRFGWLTVGFLAGSMDVWLVVCMVGWLVGWLAGWLLIWFTG
jgi:hypothetical protein